MSRNFQEYEIIIDVNQPLSLDVLDEKLPPLEPVSLTPIEYREQSFTDVGLINDDLLNQDFELGLELDMPMLDHFYEDAEETEARRQKEVAKESKQPRVRREPVYLERRRDRFSNLDENEQSTGGGGDKGEDAAGNENSSSEKPQTKAVSEIDRTDKQNDDEAPQLVNGKNEQLGPSPIDASEQEPHRGDGRAGTNDASQTDTATQQDNQNEEKTDDSRTTLPSSKDITKSCSNVFIDRKHMLIAMCRRDDGTERKDVLNLNNYLGWDGQNLKWSGGGFLRFVRSCTGNATSIQATVRVRGQLRYVTLEGVNEHVYNDGGTLRYSVEPLRFAG